MEIPENFKSTIIDFMNDLTITFPEYAKFWGKWTTGMNEEDATNLFEYCLTVFPERFFDILYQNEDIFKDDSINTYFLPNINFANLYNCEGVSKKTQQTIWKYLQILLFSVVGSVKDKSFFGDSANIFEGIDENELQNKMKETLEGIGKFFSKMPDAENPDFKMPDMFDPENPDFKMPDFKMPDMFDPENPDFKMPDFNFEKTTGMPNMENIHEHLKGLFDGKIGSLAKNIAEELSGDFESMFGEDFQQSQTTGDIFQKLMKNPVKMMEIVKKLTDKIKNKMDSGEFSKDDMMQEAGEILKKMRDMTGGEDKMQEMFQTLAKQMGLGKNAKIDKNAVDRLMKTQSIKDKLRNNLNKKKEMDAKFTLEQTGNATLFKLTGEEPQPRSIAPRALTDEELIAEFQKDAIPKKTENASKKSKNKKKPKNKK